MQRVSVRMIPDSEQECAPTGKQKDDYDQSYSREIMGM